MIRFTSTRPPTEDGQKYMLAFRNLGLATPCPRLATVLYENRNIPKKVKGVNRLIVAVNMSKQW